MSVVVRCYELKIFDITDEKLISSLLFHNYKPDLLDFCNQYSYILQSSSIAEVSNVDDFNLLLEEAKKQGQEKIQRGIMSEDDLNYKLDGMKKAYMEVVKR